MKLSIIMPVYNERETISEILQRVREVDLPKEIIVVDDGSTDGTREILRREEGKEETVVVYHGKNQGKGAAIRTALGRATGEVVIFQDGDLEYDPGDYGKLLQPILEGKSRVVYGVRTLREQDTLRRWGNQFLTLVTNLLYGVGIQDMETCYKMVSKEVIDQFSIKSNRFDIEPEITAKILKRGYRIFEVPISYTPRRERKLSPWKDGLPALWALIKYRFVE
ncbi:MAG: glycosyltransferase family 2 protein [Anaerolineae bacterium]